MYYFIYMLPYGSDKASEIIKALATTERYNAKRFKTNLETRYKKELADKKYEIICREID